MKRFIIVENNPIMKRIFLLFTIFVGSTNFINAQDLALNEKLVSFYENTSRAEMAIIEEDYPKAVAYYDKAFATGYQFPVDLHNALTAACEFRDSVKGKILF